MRSVHALHCRLLTAQEPIKMLYFADGTPCHIIINVCYNIPFIVLERSLVEKLVFISVWNFLKRKQNNGL
jgi:hypothetical protein